MSYFNIYTWMIDKLKLQGDLLLAYALIFSSLRFHQNTFLLFSDTVDSMSRLFKSDKEKTVKVIEELEKQKLIKLDRCHVNGQLYAAMHIYVPDDRYDS